MTTPPITPIEVNAEHRRALAGIEKKSDRVRYAIEHNPGVADVKPLLDWLSAHEALIVDGREITRSYASTIATSYRKGRAATDTGELPKLTPEVMARFEAMTPDEITEQPPAPTVQTEIESTPEPVQTPPVAVQTADPITSARTEVRTPVDPSPTTEQAPTGGKSRGTGPFYAAAVLCSGLSLDTAYRFFGERLHIDGFVFNGVSVELIALCGIGEFILLACGYAMRHNVRRPEGKPGPAQALAFALLVAASLMAIALDGPVAGGVRAFFGPFLALAALHMALGIEVHVKQGKSNGTFARIGREVRERLLSRLGLADDNRDAAARTRDRAADRAARLAAGHFVPFRRARLARAIRQSDAGIDPRQRERLVAQLRAQKTLGDLTGMKVDVSPWR